MSLVFVCSLIACNVEIGHGALAYLDACAVGWINVWLRMASFYLQIGRPTASIHIYTRVSPQPQWRPPQNRHV